MGKRLGGTSTRYIHTHIHTYIHTYIHVESRPTRLSETYTRLTCTTSSLFQIGCTVVLHGKFTLQTTTVWYFWKVIRTLYVSKLPQVVIGRSYVLLESSPTKTIPSRQDFLHQSSSSLLLLGIIAGTSTTVKPPPSTAFAFDGCVGGLGKTKPVTGVKLFEESSTPIHFDDTRLIVALFCVQMTEATV
jgi:hypothetical protein